MDDLKSNAMIKTQKDKPSVFEKIEAFNKGRNPKLILQKYKKMREDRYAFFRSTAHLFFQDIPKNSFLFKSPKSWICGDLHLENYGSYLGANGRPYFNINDFDEALLGPCLLDVARMLCSIHLASGSLKINENEAEKLAVVFLDTYFKKLREGYIQDLEKDNATGIIKKLLQTVKKRKKSVFITERTTVVHTKKVLKIDNKHTAVLAAEVKIEIEKALRLWAAKSTRPAFFTVLDSAFRIAGISSLGLHRYIVLIKGDKASGGNCLLDLKETRIPCAKKYVKVKQPQWQAQADRIVEVQKRIQANPPALLNSIDIKGVNFVIKELQPSADKIDYRLFHLKPKKLQNVLEHMASVCAWGNLRSAGRQQSAIADELIAFAGKEKELKKDLLIFARNYVKKMQHQFDAYCLSYDQHFN